MLQYSSRQIAASILFFLATVCSIAGWIFFLDFIRSEVGLIVPAVLFSLFGVFVLVLGVLFAGRLIGVAVSAVLAIPGMFLAPTVFYVLFSVIAILSALFGVGKIREDIGSRMHLSFRLSMSAGIFFISFPVALLLSVAYYAQIRSAQWNDLVPHFSLSEGVVNRILGITGSLYPDLGNIRDGDMTVDDFLREVRSTRFASDEILVGISDDVVSALSLEAGRAELSSLVGRSISGEERMIEVFSETLRNKMIAFLSSARAEQNLPSGALPFFLSVLLFITLISMASLLQGILTLCAAFVIRLLIWVGVLSVEKIPAEREVLL